MHGIGALSASNRLSSGEDPIANSLKKLLWGKAVALHACTPESPILPALGTGLSINTLSAHNKVQPRKVRDTADSSGQASDCGVRDPQCRVPLKCRLRIGFGVLLCLLSLETFQN